ncbi:MAG: EAL domain-containing protein [Candidatus Thiodiazotropha endolucinida]|uniref:cyclic-guanylate-specific phosphodiesterase n=1 Tax=Candidatus Thiodiazotropha taylori TaxID=2792791 RepID=A0A9E4NM71_9GAMM|nr:EAL domain-containing protein [Candidatus Thiodiazotropha taylori]MCW4237442.1 EAL domain-containing protein [Candidatus Thiodiazotropha endolucinida]
MSMLKQMYSKRSILLVSLCIALILLLVVYWDDKSENYAELSHNLLQLKEMDARLDRDVLKITSFLLNQYDPLVRTTNRLRDLRQRIVAKVTEVDDRVLSSLTDRYWQGMDEKLAIIEKIKFQAAVVRNGIHYLPIVARELKSVDPMVYQDVLELLNSLLAYDLFYTDSQLDDIVSTLKQLKSYEIVSAENKQKFDQVLFHIDSNIVDLTNLGALKTRYLAVPSQEYFEHVHSRYEQNRVDETSKKRRLIMALSVFVIVLLLSLWQLIRRLQNANHEVSRAWYRLHDAVENLSEAFALFDAEGRLVLHNRRFGEFYSWLKGWIKEGVNIDALQSVTGNRIKNLSLEGESIVESMPMGQYLEQIDNGAWYLASNSYTNEGGIVCVRSDVTESKQAEVDLRKLGRVLEQSPASVMITDINGIIEYVNPRFEKVSGYSAEEVVGKNPRILKSGDKTKEEYKAMWDSLLAGREWRGIFHNKRKDGSIYWESASISPLRDDRGQITHFIAVKEDVTAQKRAEDQLRMNATVFDTTQEGIMVTDADNLIKTVNPSFTRITGYSSEEVIGQSPSILSSGRHDDGFYEELWDSVLHKRYWSGEIWNRRKDGSVYPEWLSIAAIPDEQGIAKEYVAVFSDISKHKENEEQILYQANYDALTGLPNRSLFSDRLDQAIGSALREQWKLAILFVDLDQFKMVNDTFGHVMGDELLQLVAKRISDCVRESDTIARFGGDEFVILLQDVSDMDAVAHIATKVIDKITKVFTLYEREIFIGASVGITIFPDDAMNADSLLRNADMAMYQAKDRGRNNYQFFTASMQKRTLERQQLELDLRLAVQRSELEIYYQPVVDAEFEKIVSVEALLRWNHPHRGIVNPGVFIPLAEDSGLIGPIGEWVLQGACEQLNRWHNSGHSDLRLAVNLSSRQRELGLEAGYLQQILQESNLDPDMLSLEITESLLLRDTEEAITWLSSFKTLGVNLSIDDFGTGYSSLSYLKRFPVDILKIDRSFVSDLPENTGDVKLVKTIVAMADSLNLGLIAEGVETKAQADFLVQNGCSNLQGYYYARPMSAADMSAWLQRDMRSTGTT